MKKKNKIQHLLITHLLKEGSIELALPDGIVLELGITKEDRYGDLEKCNDYCYIIASQDGREISMDSYNLGLRFSDDQSNMLVEDTGLDEEGQPIKILEVN